MTDLSSSPSAFTVLPFTMDTGVMARAAIGLVVLATDQTLEHEWRQIMRLPGVAFFEARLHNSSDITPQNLAAMEQDITGAVQLIVPDVPLQVVAFGCTSGSIVIGEEQVANRIRQARPGVGCTTPITGAVAGLRQLGVRRIALITPYVQSVNSLFEEHLIARGFEVTHIASFNHSNDNEVARIDASSLRAAILATGAHDDVDAVFVSCTSLRMVELTQEVEQALGKPVISSNSAMAWHALRLAGVHDSLPQFGKLFEN